MEDCVLFSLLYSQNVLDLITEKCMLQSTDELLRCGSEVAVKTVAISYSDLHGDSRSALLLYSRILETARSDEYRYDSFTRLILRFRIPCHAGKILLIAAIHRSKDTITTIPSSHHLSCILSPFNSSALSRHHHPSIYIYTYIYTILV
jgi:hypothetical protein